VSGAGAPQLARLEVVPCLVKDVADEAAVAIALIENIQREDLNAIEEAVALQRLLTEFELTPRLPRRWASPAPRSPTCCASISSTRT
jgi:ParB/RepB/Spo0J family partition protein